MARKFWWPTSLADQLVLMQNFQTKIGGYGPALGLTVPQTTAAKDLCGAFITAFTFAEQSKQTMQAVTQWRDIVFSGTPEGDPAPLPPVFAVGSITPLTRGVVTQFFEFRDLVVALPNYTEAIGEDLGIVGAEKSSLIESDVAPDLKTSVSTGYWINISGSMQGMDAMRVEYARNGGQFAPVAFFTNTPGGFQITPNTPNQPEAGHVRAVFIKKNVEYGNYSPDYPVTVS